MRGLVGILSFCILLTVLAFALPAAQTLRGDGKTAGREDVTFDYSGAAADLLATGAAFLDRAGNAKAR